MPQAADQVRTEESNEQGQHRESEITVDVLPMVEEVSVNDLVNGDDQDDDEHPDSPVGNEMLSHEASFGFCKLVVKPGSTLASDTASQHPTPNTTALTADIRAHTLN